MALSGYQVAETQLCLEDGTRSYRDFHEDGDSVSSGSLSLDLGEMWRSGCPKRVLIGTVMAMNSVEEEERESVMDHLRQVIESPCGLRCSSSWHQMMSFTCARRQ